jgi:hypothetical protein
MSNTTVLTASSVVERWQERLIWLIMITNGVFGVVSFNAGSSEPFSDRRFPGIYIWLLGPMHPPGLLLDSIHAPRSCRFSWPLPLELCAFVLHILSLSDMYRVRLDIEYAGHPLLELPF